MEGCWRLKITEIYIFQFTEIQYILVLMLFKEVFSSSCLDCIMWKTFLWEFVGVCGRKCILLQYI